MDALVVLLSVVSLVCGLVLAFVIYQLIRIFYAWARDRFHVEGDGKSPFMLLRLSPRVVGVLCALCFLALVV